MQKNKDISLAKELLKGSLICAAVFAVMAMLFSFIILKTNMDRSNYFVLLVFSAVLSGVIGGFSAVRKKRENGLIYGLLCSAVPSILLIGVMSIAFNGFSSFELIPAGLCLCGGAVGGIAAVNIKKQKKIKRKTR